MKSVPPRWRKPRSSTESTRRPRLTFARIGLRLTSNASSVTERSVTRTGTTRCLLQTNSVSGASSGSTSSTPGRGERVVRLQVVGARLDQLLEHRELRVDSERDGDRVRVRVVELLGRVDLRLELDRLDRRPLQPQRLGLVGAAAGARRLHLQRPRERVRVVLERDRAQDAARVRVDLDEAALEQAG